MGDGRSFKREGARVCLWLSHVVRWQKPTQHCKATTLQLKITFQKFSSHIFFLFCISEMIVKITILCCVLLFLLLLTMVSDAFALLQHDFKP